VAACLFDPKISRAWLSTIEADQDAHPQALLLCQVHADSLSVPNTWSLTDIRVVSDPQLATFLAGQKQGADQREGFAAEADGGSRARVTASGGKAKASGSKAKTASGSKAKTASRDAATAAHNSKTSGEDSGEAPDYEEPAKPEATDEDLPLLSRAFRSVAAT